MRPFRFVTLCFRLRCPGLFSFCSTPAAYFRIVAFRSHRLFLPYDVFPFHFVSLRFASLRLAVVDLPSHSVSSRSFRLGFDFFHLRLRIVSFRLACLRLHSTSTFLHISGRPVLRPQGGGVGHRRQNKTPKTPNQKPTKKKPQQSRRRKGAVA
jgi:hypothetical protein